MEEYKDVMLSEPPSRFHQSAPAIQAVSLENYKGILLCDRPGNLFTLGQNRAGQQQDSVAPFLPSGKVDDKFLGLQPTQEQRTRLELCRALRKESSNSIGKAGNPALSKHRRWLRSFAQAVKEMKLSQAEQQQDYIDFKERMKAQQAEQRQQRLAQQQQQWVSETQQQTEAAAAPIEDTKKSATPPTAAKDAKSKVKGKSKSKPKWAMTEDEALDAELNEHQKLVKFAKELNFDKFINDYEVQEALAIMQDRVKELAKENGVDLETAKECAASDDDEGGDDNISVAPSNASTTTREVYAAKRLARKKAAEDAAAAEGTTVNGASWNNSVKVGEAIRSAITADALALADKILSTSESMRQIHTRNSLAKLLQHVCLGGAGGAGSQQQDVSSTMAVGASVAPPVVATVAAEATGLQNNASDKRILTKLRLAKDKTQNLPYLYRCPSL